MMELDEVKNMSPNRLISWFMISSYAYYRLGKRVMEDYCFDYLVQRLKEGCYDISDHYHKKYVTKEHLNAGTGFDIEYPTIVKAATKLYMKEKGIWN